MIRTHDANVLDRFTDVLPLCARHDEDYLREIAKNIQLVEPPVTMSLDVMSSGGFRAKETRCLVVTPQTVAWCVSKSRTSQFRQVRI